MFGAPPIKILHPQQLINDTHPSSRGCSPSPSLYCRTNALGLGGATLNLLQTATGPEAAATSTLICSEESLVPFYRLASITKTAAPPRAWPRPLSPLCVQVTESPTQPPPQTLTHTPAAHIPFVNLSDSDTKHFGVTSTCCLRPPPPPSLLHSWQLRIVGKNVC